MTTRYIILLLLVVAVAAAVYFLSGTLFRKNETVSVHLTHFYDININTLSGNPLDLADFKNRVVLVVNVASNCGFTGQYEGLEALYQQFKSRDFVILGVPSNDFGGQEPGTAEDIQAFCKVNYGVSFPMAEKVTINGENQHDLYNFLTQSNPDYSGRVKWNFTKFLIDRNGHVVDRFAPVTKPLSAGIIKRIEEVIQ